MIDELILKEDDYLEIVFSNGRRIGLSWDGYITQGRLIFTHIGKNEDMVWRNGSEVGHVRGIGWE